MTELDLSTEIDAEIDFKALKQRFVMLNQARLQHARSALKERQEGFLDLLPLLFHVNHPLLPGYSSKFTPCGVWGYEPERKVLNHAKRLARSFSYSKPTGKQSPLLALYFMGSSGTIGHSEESDFDIWLCHEPKLGPDQLLKLQQKADGIEAWAATLGLEIHFFFINPERFRQEPQGAQGALSSESSGSAQHSLLLDEFYRTGVLLEGQYPLWWLVPPGYEAAYELYVEQLHRKRFLYARDTIDFGGLAHIPAEEFFGAALWQLSKGIDSPYKSILKLLLIESYAREYPAVQLLSKQFKQAIYDGIVDPEQLDPYILMLRKVSDYLQHNNERQRLELARRCFYFKAAIPLGTGLAAQRADWRHELLLTLTKSWGWTRADLMLMDAHSQWRVHRVLEERQILFQALTSSYRLLSGFARKYAGLSLISQEDLTTLGRKLYTAFERKAGKIDIITRGIDAELSEPQVTVVEMISNDGESGWQVYNGVVTQENLRLETPMKRTRSLTELLAWCHLNGVTGPNSTFVVYSGNSCHTTREVETLSTRIAQRFPVAMLQSHDMRDYASAAVLLRSEFYVNTGVRLSENMLMTKNIAAIGHTDPFHFGHQGGSLVLAVDQLSLNSWREAIAYRFTGDNAVLDALCNYLKWYPLTAPEPPPQPDFYSGATALGSAVAKRVEKLFQTVIEHFYGDPAHHEDCFLVTIGNSHYSFYFDNGAPRYEVFCGLAALLAHLGKPREGFLSVVADKRSLRASFLPLLYERNKPGVVQFFFHPLGGDAEIFVLDEKGTLFHQHTPFYDESTLLNHFSRFFESVSNRVNFMLQEGQAGGGIKGVEFYRISSDAIGRRRAKMVAPEFYQQNKSYFSLQVIVEQNDSGQSIFTLYCDGKEFSTLEHGTELFNTVVQHVLVLRNSGQRYPIYITDISLDRLVVGEENVNKMQSSHFLNYKRRIEEQLNRSMKG
ncbi:MAG: class I adenylate cyclase [Gammaproteobacteria bacterium]|nr:class I adenylate cyclase [Gammaproteobacteria bacterium]